MLGFCVCIRWLQNVIKLQLCCDSAPPWMPAVVHKDGKNARPFVFTIHSQHLSSHPVQTLDVAADTLEDLTGWVGKIREATQNADARVGTTARTSTERRLIGE